MLCIWRYRSGFHVIKSLIESFGVYGIWSRDQPDFFLSPLTSQMVSCLLFIVAVDLFSVFTSALIILKIFSTNQITENQNWGQRLHGIIQTGNAKNCSLWNCLFNQGLNNSYFISWTLYRKHYYRITIYCFFTICKMCLCRS